MLPLCYYYYSLPYNKKPFTYWQYFTVNQEVIYLIFINLVTKIPIVTHKTHIATQSILFSNKKKKRVCPVTWALRRVSWAQMKSWTMNIFNSFGFRLSQKNSTIGWLDVRVQTTAFPLTHFRDWWSNVLLSLGILGIHFDVSEHLKESFWQHGSEYFCEELFKSTYIGFLELHKTDI